MSTLTVAPSPALKGSVVRIDGANFPNAKTRLLLDGVGATTNIFRPAANGSFHVGITVSSTVRVQTLAAQQADSKGRWVQVASVTIPVVTTPPVEPPPVITVPPPLPGAIDVAPPSAPVFTGDATGQTDVSAALMAFLTAGGQRALKPYGSYRADQRVQTTLAGLDLFGQGATIRSQGLYAPNLPDSWLRLVKCQNVHLRDFDLIGPAAADVAATTWKMYGWSREDWRGLIIDGGKGITFERVKSSRFYGDSLYIARRDGPVDALSTPDGVTLIDCDFRQAGRNAVSLTAGKNITVTGGYIGDGGLAAWDTEPNLATDITSGVHFTGTHFGPGDVGETVSASHDSKVNGYAVYVSAGAAPARDYSFDHCQFDVGSLYVVANGGRNANIAIRDCTATKGGDARFAGTDGIVFDGNVGIARVGQ